MGEAGGWHKRKKSASNDEKRENCCHEVRNLEMVSNIWWAGDDFRGTEYFYPEGCIGCRKVLHLG